jgi:hypothetical protein
MERSRTTTSPTAIEHRTWRPPWAAVLLAAAGFLLLPWIALLLAALPQAYRATHWDIAWAGLDAAMAVLLVALAWAVWRGSPWLQGVAAATATLLLVDAWFDVLTSSTTGELVAAGVEAGLVEVPLAILCLLVAHRARRRLPRTRTAERPS